MSFVVRQAHHEEVQAHHEEARDEVITIACNQAALQPFGCVPPACGWDGDKR
jgi:hypothetical protein